MENCLVTKLRAVINNPDLPVIETIQQFTLDAIAASQNSSMSDAQKAALNHFFYQIGAIDNNGIFAKLELLLLSFIGGTKEGALVDFAKNRQVFGTFEAVSFSDGGFISDVNNRTFARYSLSGFEDNYFLFVAGMQTDIDGAIIGKINDADTSMAFSMKDGQMTMSPVPYTQYSSYVTAIYSSQERRAASINVRNHAARVLLIDGENVSESNNVTYRRTEEGFAGEEVRLRADPVNNAQYAFALGASLTDAEQTTFMSEIKTLMDAFAE